MSEIATNLVIPKLHFEMKIVLSIFEDLLRNLQRVKLVNIVHKQYTNIVLVELAIEHLITGY